MNVQHHMLGAFSALLPIMAGLFATSQQLMAEEIVRPQRYTLVIHMSPAICALDPSKRTLRQCQEGFSLTIASLKPEVAPSEAERCTSKDAATLTPLQARVVDRVMPDERLRQEDWQRNGGCTGMNASTYFRTIANYAGKLRVPPEFNAAGQVTVQKNNLLNQLKVLNTALPVDGVQLRCAQNPSFNVPVLTEVRVCYNPRGQYVSCPATVRSNCPASFLIQGAP